MTENCALWIDDGIDGKCKITGKICGVTCHLTPEQEKEVIKKGYVPHYELRAIKERDFKNE